MKIRITLYCPDSQSAKIKKMATKSRKSKIIFVNYVGDKKNKVWLIYAYHSETGEIVTYVWGKHNYKTANELRKKLKALGITYNKICTDA